MIKALPPLPGTVRAAMIPRWDKDYLIVRKCPVCNADSCDAVCKRPDQLSVHACNVCGMLYLAEIPHGSEINNYYQAYCENKGYSRTRKKWLELTMGSLLDFNVNILETTGGLKDKKLLEIGCAFGDFLQYCAYKSAQVSGIEIDEDARSFLKHLGFSASPSFDPTSRYDIVCAFQVLEHLAAPGEMIKSISESLPYDGRFLLSVPNGEEAKKMGMAWLGFRVDMEHINYFDLKSLGNLLQQHNLCIEQYWEHRQPNITRAGIGCIQEKWLLRKIKAILNIYLNMRYGRQAEVPNQGTFVLTVLARKC